MLFAGSIVSNIQNTWKLEALNLLCCSSHCVLLLVGWLSTHAGTCICIMVHARGLMWSSGNCNITCDD